MRSRLIGGGNEKVEKAQEYNGPKQLVRGCVRRLRHNLRTLLGTSHTFSCQIHQGDIASAAPANAAALHLHPPQNPPQNPQGPSPRHAALLLDYVAGGGG